MELLSSNIKKIKEFFYILGNVTFPPQPPKLFPKKISKKTRSEKVSYIFSKEVPNFLEMETLKNPYISGNRIFFPVTFQDQNLFMFFLTKNKIF